MSKKSTKAKHPEVKQHIQAPHKFDDSEIAVMNNELRENLGTIETLTDQKKQSAQDFKLRIDTCANRVKLLRMKLDSGEETRPLEAIVEFDVKRGSKKFLHPVSREFIREEQMQASDYELPLFKKADDGSEKPAVEVAKPAKGKKTKEPKSEPGETNVGDAIGKAAAGTEQKPLDMALVFPTGVASSAIIKAFRGAAKRANWSPAATSLIVDQLKDASTTDAMIDILRPHTAATE
jgi:hypothetical protein